MPLTGEVPREPRVIGRYLLHSEIASGGMASVHYGKLLGQVGFSRTVAIKRLHAHFAKEPEFVSMFIDEARLAARVQHPNVVSTLDVVARDGELFLVMEYVQGETLARLLRAARSSGERIPVPIAVSIMAGVLDGLHAAHEASNERGELLGIVHRDVSPQNVIVGVDGVARVLDFGVAKAVGRLQTTRDGQIKGKLPYMAPEQLRHEAVDRRTDVYAASVVLWEVLAGRRLFKADDEVAIFGMVIDGKVDPPSTIAELPPGLDDVVMRGLATDAEARYPTGREMALALESVVSPASPREIGRWVERMAGENLKLRADRVAELESVSEVRENITTRADRSPPRRDPPPDSLPPTQAIVSRLKGSRRNRALVAAAVVVAALVALGIALTRGKATTDRSESQTSAQPVPEPALTAPAPSVAQAAVTSSALETPPASASATRTKPRKVRVSEPRKTPAREKPPNDCSPPYTLDPQGVQIPKPQCL